MECKPESFLLALTNHQGIGNIILFPDSRLTQIGPVVKTERHGGQELFRSSFVWSE